MSVSLAMHGDVAVMTLDDGKRNAVNHALIDGIFAALDEAQEKKAKCLVIKGREGCFSAGFDLKFFASSTMEEVLGLVNRGGILSAKLLRYPMPTIAACTGHGVAMGSFTLLSCDFSYGIEGDFRIGCNESQINMILPAFGFELTNERLCPRYRSAAVVEGRLFSPEEAVQAGFLDAVLPAAELDATVMEHANKLAQFDPSYLSGNRIGSREHMIKAIEAAHQ